MPIPKMSNSILPNPKLHNYCRHTPCPAISARNPSALVWYFVLIGFSRRGTFGVRRDPGLCLDNSFNPPPRSPQESGSQGWSPVNYDAASRKASGGPCDGHRTDSFISPPSCGQASAGLSVPNEIAPRRGPEGFWFT